MNTCTVLEAIWNSYEMTDAVIVCSDGSVRSHKAILAAASPCLKEAMLGLGDEPGEDSFIFLPESQVQDVLSVLALIYLGFSCVDASSHLGVMETASALGLNLNWSWWEDQLQDVQLPENHLTANDPACTDFPFDFVAMSAMESEVTKPDERWNFPAECNLTEQTQVTQIEVQGDQPAPKVQIQFISANAPRSKKKYDCGICDKAFETRYHVERHRRIHEKISNSVKLENVMSCYVCKKSFKNFSLLDRHLRVHTGSRPFSCETCGESFTRSHHLVDHQKRHSKEKPFGCPLCGKNFVRRTTLDVHLKTRHWMAKSFECDICGRCFGRGDVLKRHKLLKHKADRSVRPSCDVKSVESPGPSGDPLSYFEDISVSSVMTSYENFETDFVLTSDPALDFH